MPELFKDGSELWHVKLHLSFFSGLDIQFHIVRCEGKQADEPVDITCFGNDVAYDFDRFAGFAFKNIETELTISGTGQLLEQRQFRNGDVERSIRNWDRQLRQTDGEFIGIRCQHAAEDLDQDIWIVMSASLASRVTITPFLASCFSNTPCT